MNYKFILFTLKKNKMITILILLQTGIVLTALIGIISIYLSRSQNYMIEKQFWDQKGYVMNIDLFLGRNEDDFLNYTDSKDIENTLKQAKVSAIYYGQIDFGFSPIKTQSDTIVYDDSLLECYTPVLESGRWLSKSDQKSDEIEIVLAQKQPDYKVGDTIYIKNCICVKGEKLSVPVPAKVVGILADGANVIGNSNIDTTYGDFRDYYFNVDRDNLESPIVFMSHQDLVHNNDVYMKKEEGVTEESLWPMALSNLCFITFDAEISKEHKKWNEQYILFNASYNRKKSLEQVNKNSKIYIESGIEYLYPTFIGMLIFTLISIMGSTVILAKETLRDYAICYICGSTWNKSVSLFGKSMLILQIGVLMTEFLILVLSKQFGLLKNTVFDVGKWQFLLSLVICLLFIVTSISVRQFMCGKKCAVDVLREAKR